MALYDSVTGLPNRHFLNIYLKDVLEEAANTGEPVALMFIDFDKFKIINDTMGHGFGDKVLKAVSKIMEKCLGEDDFISRYAGDEFVIVLKNTWPERARQKVKCINSRFSASIDVEGNAIDITPSIGISIYPINSSDVETLIKYADMAMYQAKSQGRNNYRFYEPRMSLEITRRMQVEGDLRRAIENNEFIIHYQPLVDIMSGDICCAEALIRWRHPHFGLISPDEFIPIAEETGLIIPIGEWVLRNACMQNIIWQDRGLRPIDIAVNVSYKQLKHKGFIDLVQEVLKESGLRPEQLELEITESVLKDVEEFKEILTRLRPIGIRLAIDDFGVGYSSLSILQHIGINYLKIDRSFIESMLDNEKTAAIVRAVIDIGKNLNCTIIAEGIETREQVDFLKLNYCDIGQGYYFSKPLEADAFEEFFKNWKGL